MESIGVHEIHWANGLLADSFPTTIRPSITLQPLKDHLK